MHMHIYLYTVVAEQTGARVANKRSQRDASRGPPPSGTGWRALCRRRRRRRRRHRPLPPPLATASRSPRCRRREPVTRRRRGR
eukprot:scaffold50689_cov64-Phaeocystis_antarctica.AAC.2